MSEEPKSVIRRFVMTDRLARVLTDVLVDESIVNEAINFCNANGERAEELLCARRDEFDLTIRRLIIELWRNNTLENTTFFALAAWYIGLHFEKDGMPAAYSRFQEQIAARYGERDDFGHIQKVAEHDFERLEREVIEGDLDLVLESAAIQLEENAG